MNKCTVCGEETSGECQVGGDINSNGNLSGVADCPKVVLCGCGLAWFEDERCPEHDEGKTLLERWNR